MLLALQSPDAVNATKSRRDSYAACLGKTDLDASSSGRTKTNSLEKKRGSRVETTLAANAPHFEMGTKRSLLPARSRGRTWPSWIPSRARPPPQRPPGPGLAAACSAGSPPRGSRRSPPGWSAPSPPRTRRWGSCPQEGTRGRRCPCPGACTWSGSGGQRRVRRGHIPGAGANRVRGGGLLRFITSFYGSSCANNGKGALTQHPRR
eukprot:5030587-Pyramimonas_sp.AAC.1